MGTSSATSRPAGRAAIPSVPITSLDLGGDLVFVTDASGTILDVNDAFVRVTGYSRAEAIGASPRLLRSGLQDDEFYADLWRTITAGETWQGQLVDRHRDGRLRTHRVTITPIRDGSGQVTHFVAVERDVSGDLGRQLASASVGVVHTDRVGRCTYADGRAAALLRRAASDLLGGGLAQALVREDADAVREVVGMVMEEGREHRTDLRTVGHDGRVGTWLHAEVSPLTVADGTVIGAAWSLEDVTERMDLHRELSRRDALLASVLDALPEAVAVVDVDGVVVAANAAWNRRTSRSVEETVVAARVGENLLTGLDAVAARGDDLARDLGDDLRRVISGRGRAPIRHGEVRVLPLAWDHGGAVLRVPD